MRPYIRLFDFQQQVNYGTELLSGLTVALALVPEAVAFALIAGLSPLTGLYAAFVMGLVTSSVSVFSDVSKIHSAGKKPLKTTMAAAIQRRRGPDQGDE